MTPPPAANETLDCELALEIEIKKQPMLNVIFLRSLKSGIALVNASDN